VTAPPAGFAAVRLEGHHVTLRPYAVDEVGQFASLVTAPDGGTAIAPGASFAWPLGFPPQDRLRERVEASGRFVQSLLELAIESDGRFAGSIQARNPVPCSPPGVFMLGIAIVPEQRGRGIGGQAVALLTTHLFRQEDAQRVEMPTDVENVPMRSVAERLGFVFEGVLRSLMPMGDERRDYCMYAMTRGDWEKNRDRWTQRS
jgi:ribosomal-protein-alanine N-acetyltransferase